ncbi:MAG: DUF3892 domain-containing protein [Lentisphaeraceae bacterium]|nr:DUF3892 domain-containing protein [Lentisphaeraceae bacterium]
MSLLDSKVYAGISIKVFDDLFKGYHSISDFGTFKIDQTIQLLENNDSLPITGHLEVKLNLPEFSLRERANGDLYTALTLRGRVELKVSSPTAESPVLHAFPIAADLNVSLILITQSGNNPPKIGLRYDGIENLDAPISVDQMNLAVHASGVINVINQLQIDILSPLIQGMETVLFFGQDASNIPSRSDYIYNLRPMKGFGNHVDAYGLFVSLPGDNISASNVPSFVPSFSDVSLVLNETMINAMVDNAKAELQEFIEGLANTVKVTSLTAVADNNKISLDAKIKETKTDTKIDIDTDVYLHLVPGSTRIGLKATIDVDYDFPWYIDLLKAFIVGEDELLEEKIPNMAQKYVEDIANDMLGELSESIKLEGLTVSGIPVEVYPQSLSLDDGQIQLHVRVLSYNMVDRLVDASHSSLRDKFIFFKLQSGSRYATKDLARFMDMGLITVPGYHQVDREYIRANPDDSEANNLLARFGRP